MKPMAAAAVGALVSGVAFYAVGTRAAQDNPFAEMPALVQTVDGRYIQVPNAKPVGYGYVPNGYVTALPPAAEPVLVAESPAPRRTVYRTAEPVQERVVVRERTSPRRPWTKTALIIGGSTASGAGVGGIVGGKKGALIGAAIGGGAASIYEATRR
ncbi:MAG: hypothetical protein HYU37_02835 [Acidobacteria bacterium]|nr:hypothetical protein [Acidobacteriota bacterium]